MTSLSALIRESIRAALDAGGIGRRFWLLATLGSNAQRLRSLPDVNLVRVNLVALCKVGNRRLIPHLPQNDIRLQRCVNLASVLVSHHPLCLSMKKGVSNLAGGPKMEGHFINLTGAETLRRN